MSVSEAMQAGMAQTNLLFGSAAVRERKIDALNDIYTVDATILPPGADLIQGRDPIKRFWQQAIEGLGLKDAKLTSLDVQAAGDGAVEVGRAELTLSDGQTLAGKYVVHWKQEDGRWKWHTDIWNMNQ
jgi:ketosteroid isomerase-like protein